MIFLKKAADRNARRPHIYSEKYPAVSCVSVSHGTTLIVVLEARG